MGYTFAAALLKKAGTAPSTRKAFRGAMETLGYRKAASAEEASLSLCMYQDKKSAWLSLALDMPEDLGKELEFLRSIAAEMHTPILYFMNFDSDFLLLAATDGEQVQCTHIGYADDDDGDLPPDSDDLSVFDALLPDDAARTEFRRILAVDMEERVFSESAAQEMATLFGYTPEVLFIDEDATPFAEFNFDLPGGEAAPFLMPEDAPPSFAKIMSFYSNANPTAIRLTSSGGAGRGVRVVMQAVGYDAQDWNAPVVAICHSSSDFRLRFVAENYCRVVPRRVKFQNGGEGWEAIFPDIVIEPGVNSEHPKAMSKKSVEYMADHNLELCIAFTGGTLHDPRRMQNVFTRSPQEQAQSVDGLTRVFVQPLENPNGFVSYELTRIPFSPKPLDKVWLEGFIPSEE